MRTDKQIDKEIKVIEKLLEKKDRWNNETREMMEAQIEVLSNRMTERQIETRWWTDETTEEYEDGDNNLYHELIRTRNWMKGEADYEAPSKNAL